MEGKMKEIESNVKTLLGNVRELASNIHGITIPIPASPSIGSPIYEQPTLSPPPRATLAETTSHMHGAKAAACPTEGNQVELMTNQPNDEVPIAMNLFSELPVMQPMGRQPEREGERRVQQSQPENYEMHSPSQRENQTHQNEPVRSSGFSANDKSSHPVPRNG